MGLSNGVFPDGNFEAWLEAARAGTRADAKLEFFFRLADANHDRSIDTGT